MSLDFKSSVKSCWQYFKLTAGGLLVLFAALGLMVPKSEHLERYERLEIEGAVATGKVVEKPTSENRLPPTALNKLGPAGGFASGVISGNRLNNALNGTPNKDPLTLHYHYVAYEFRTPQNVVVKHQVPVTAEQHKRIAVGGPIQVRYHPQNAQIHRLIDYSNPFPIITFEMQLQGALLGSFLGGLFIWRGWPKGGNSPASPGPSSETGRMQRVTRPGGAASPQIPPGRPMGTGGARPARRPGFGQRA